MIGDDPRYGTLAVALGVAAFVVLVRDRRGDPPPPASEPAFPTGIELVIADAGAITTCRFGRRILVGRAPNAHVRIADPRVSRLHARIEMRNDGVYVEDLGSRNGTRVNGEEISGSRRLGEGDEIGIGTASIIFRGVGAWK